ncbi:hypothetical protein A2276_07590 [candidate division WOR-1 bacterium RIFOXYA12_FULL_43_27]|uniref:Haem-binding uptake Tiki superfamily ChaN domain-containing protein n=1 Tax=candidate division WOR-1 bacterium RIFOXYC2_FULL_46_14 TaxID=1802587 RepID=A0A1F4U667_UNCSA|nr:MAG: hypothetical protein A2276_07590 [candidate division WOR-1 bacterium RIFOXYA12_FULL_43_27]OGC20465.1 MAG: hypothetical protein A2292_05415 [candidate division WOR-1 bacterium RIFOXYB2_FULL_46_45]OGC31798.1 MAG: hypothetical protein A2232_06035 [candidate division WOR-1 bacterium RIFOXYA2_FULL_46_56]OGC40310.1 MAG: hypothetical protein A2438_03435 [candidate division WOR-1 bacterium RIFOXYC2_FULL_46_14]
MGEVTQCYYRKEPWLLWPNHQKECKGKGTCSPYIPKTVENKDELNSKTANRRGSFKRIPKKEKNIPQWMRRLDLKEGAGVVYAAIQREIDSSSSKQNVHIIFGVSHLVEGQTAFFNELISQGKDGCKITGTTHLSLEFGRSDENNVDLQLLIDDALITGYFPFSVDKNYKQSYLHESKGEYEEQFNTFKLAHNNCYNVVLSDVERTKVDRVERDLGEKHSYSMREIFAVDSTYARMFSDRKNVVLWRWGATHADKQRLPYLIRKKDPRAKVVAFVFNGGTYVDAYAFDRALKDQGKLNDLFLLKLSGYREADYVVHLPTGDRVRMEGISREGDPVISHIVDPY